VTDGTADLLPGVVGGTVVGGGTRLAFAARVVDAFAQTEGKCAPRLRRPLLAYRVARTGTAPARARRTASRSGSLIRRSQVLCHSQAPRHVGHDSRVEPPEYSASIGAAS